MKKRTIRDLVAATPRERDALIRLMQALNAHERQHAKWEAPGWLSLDEFPEARAEDKKAAAELLLKCKDYQAKGKKVKR